MNSPAPGEKISPLTVTVTPANDVVWISVQGEVDLSNHELLRTRLDAIELDRASLVYLDLRLLGFFDGAGCELLVRFRERTTAAGHEVRIHHARPIVRRVFALLSEPSTA